MDYYFGRKAGGLGSRKKMKGSACDLLINKAEVLMLTTSKVQDAWTLASISIYLHKLML